MNLLICGYLTIDFHRDSIWWWCWRSSAHLLKVDDYSWVEFLSEVLHTLHQRLLTAHHIAFACTHTHTHTHTHTSILLDGKSNLLSLPFQSHQRNQINIDLLHTHTHILSLYQQKAICLAIKIIRGLGYIPSSQHHTCSGTIYASGFIYGHCMQSCCN